MRHDLRQYLAFDLFTKTLHPRTKLMIVHNSAQRLTIEISAEHMCHKCAHAIDRNKSAFTCSLAFALISVGFFFEADSSRAIY